MDYLKPRKFDAQTKKQLDNVVKLATHNRSSFEKCEQIMNDITKGLANRSDLKNALEIQEDNQVDEMVNSFGKVCSYNNVKNHLRQTNPVLGGQLDEWMRSKNYVVSDTSDIRIADYSTEYDVLYTKETQFLNTLPAAVPAVASDITVKWFTYDDYTGLSGLFFAPDKGPDVSSRKRASLTNTMSFIGCGDYVGLIAEDINRNQGFTPNMDMALTSTYNLLRKNKNQFLLNSTENTTGPIYQHKGLLQFITTNVVTTITDFTDTNMAVSVLKPTVKYGPQPYIMAVGSERQAQKFDDIIKARVPGRGVADLLFNNVRTTYQGIGVDIAAVYYTRRGSVIPVIILDDLPANTALLYNPFLLRQRYLKLSSFGSGAGPYVLMSVESNGFAKVLQVFETYTLEVHNEEKMVKCTGVIGD